MKLLKDAPITQGTKVFVATDLEVDFENDKILDTFRLDCMLPSLKYIIEKGGFPILGGHIGRPKGKVVANLTTEKLRPYFDQQLEVGKYELLENLRFDPREENQDEGWAQSLAAKADIYVNEAFSTSHRNDGAITGVPKYLPAYAGFRLEKEITTLKNLLTAPLRPFVTVIGGAKLADKKSIVTKFLELADTVLVGGRVGIDWVDKLPAKLVIPTDYIGEQEDIGKETIANYASIINSAKTVLWAGPMGKYEDPKFMNGSKELALAVVNATQNNNLLSVAGGGDTLAILTMLDLRDKLSFVSTGGGAMLDFLAYGTLPGIEALEPSTSDNISSINRF